MLLTSITWNHVDHVEAKSYCKWHFRTINNWLICLPTFSRAERASVARVITWNVKGAITRDWSRLCSLPYIVKSQVPPWRGRFLERESVRLRPPAGPHKAIHREYLSIGLSVLHLSSFQTAAMKSAGISWIGDATLHLCDSDEKAMKLNVLSTISRSSSVPAVATKSKRNFAWKVLLETLQKSNDSRVYIR